MSGFVSPPVSQAQTGNGQIPATARSYYFQLSLTAGITTTFDLRALQYLNVYKDCQGFHIDNSANALETSIQIPLGTLWIVPPYSQAVFPLYLSPNNPQLSFTGSGTVNVTLINFPTPACVWGTTDEALPISGGKVQVYDATVAGLLSNPPVYTAIAPSAFSIASGGVAENVFVAGALKYGGLIFNPYNATESLFVDMVNAAQTSSPGSNGTTFEVKAGLGFSVPGGMSGAVSVNASTTGHTFTATGY